MYRVSLSYISSYGGGSYKTVTGSDLINLSKVGRLLPSGKYRYIFHGKIEDISPLSTDIVLSMHIKFLPPLEIGRAHV